MVEHDEEVVMCNITPSLEFIESVKRQKDSFEDIARWIEPHWVVWQQRGPVQLECKDSDGAVFKAVVASPVGQAKRSMDGLLDQELKDANGAVKTVRDLWGIELTARQLESARYRVRRKKKQALLQALANHDEAIAREEERQRQAQARPPAPTQAAVAATATTSATPGAVVADPTTSGAATAVEPAIPTSALEGATTATTQEHAQAPQQRDPPQNAELAKLLEGRAQALEALRLLDLAEQEVCM